jgi:ElaB/YqjD/DUF883 family membrane-anchored ribosome-binding protein
MKNSKHVPAHHHENVTKHARALVTATQHIAEDKVADARAKLSDLIDSAKDRWESIQDGAVDTAKEADNFVREKPYHALAIGIGVGALVGLFLARRK